MVVPGHEPEWPDKIMAAALFVLLGGLLAIMHGIMQLAGVSFNQESTVFLFFVPASWTLAMGAFAVTAGFFAYLHQSWLLTVLGMVFAIMSMGLLGAAPLVAMIALWPLARSFREGEETRLDRHHVRAHEWPDKAIMGSVVMAAAGAVTVMHGILLWMDRVTAPVMPETPIRWGLISIALGLIGLASAREVFRLRRPWAGWLGAVSLIAGAGFYVVGPALAIVGMVYMGLAYKEAEFLLHAPDEAVN